MKSDATEGAARAGKSVAARLVLPVLVFAGIAALPHVGRENFPDISPDTVTISVPYPGASAEEVERGIIFAVEEAVQELDGIKSVKSAAAEDGATVTVEAARGTDIHRLASEIKNGMDRITSFPADIEEPHISISGSKRKVLEFCIYADENERAMYELSERLRDGLLQGEGVTLVEISGTRRPELSIEVPMAALRRYGISMPEVADRLKAANIELAAGRIKTPRGETLIRVTERRDYSGQFELLPIVTSKTGTPITLADIGKVVDGFEDVDTLSLWNGKRAVFFKVYAVGSQTPDSVANAVYGFIAAQKKSLPENVGIAVTLDLAKKCYDSEIELCKRAAWGWLAAAVVCALFMRARRALWVAVSAPACLLGAAALMPLFGLSISLVTLAALLFSLVIAACMLANAAQNVCEKCGKFSRARFAKETAFAVLAAAVVFAPLFFIPNAAGKIFNQFPAIMIAAAALSAALCAFVIPALLRPDSAPKECLKQKGGARSKLERAGAWAAENAALNFKWAFAALGVILFAALAHFFISAAQDLQRVPARSSDYVSASLELRTGASFEKIIECGKALSASALEVVKENGGEDLARGVSCVIGDAGGNSKNRTAEARINFAPASVRKIPSAEVVEKWKLKAGDFPEAESLDFDSGTESPHFASGICVRLSHRDIATLRKASEDFMAALEKAGGVTGVDGGFDEGKEQIDFKLRDEGRVLGFTASDVARQLRGAFYGAEAVRQLRGREEMKIMARLPEAERRSDYALDSFVLISKEGKAVLLSQIATVSRGNAYRTIEREGGRRTVEITADIDTHPHRAGVSKEIEKSILPELVKKYPGLQFKYAGDQKDMMQSAHALGVGLLVSLAALFALAAAFTRSYTAGIIAILALPFGILGAIVGHKLVGAEASFLSVVGTMALCALVVKDAVLFLRRAVCLRSGGLTPSESAVRAAAESSREILTGALVAFAALAPVAFDFSAQARFFVPAAAALGFGMLFAPMGTLLFAPACFALAADLKASIKSVFQDKK